MIIVSAAPWTAVLDPYISSSVGHCLYKYFCKSLSHHLAPDPACTVAIIGQFSELSLRKLLKKVLRSPVSLVPLLLEVIIAGAISRITKQGLYFFIFILI